jgi:hypothetical protein
MADVGVAPVDLSAAPSMRRRLLICKAEPRDTPQETSRKLSGHASVEAPAFRSLEGACGDAGEGGVIYIDGECFAAKLDETSLHAIFQHLDPADLRAAMGVCKDWHRVVIEGHTWRALCNRLIGLSSEPFVRAEVNVNTESLERTEFGNWFLAQSADQKEALIFQNLTRVLSQTTSSDGAGQGLSSEIRHNLIADAIVASSTDNYPEECISKTLKEHARERTGNLLQACYWSSKGDTYANKDECLLYKLVGPLCVVSVWSCCLSDMACAALQMESAT